MHIAIFGATSEIAHDLILGFIKDQRFQLTLFCRDASKISSEISSGAFKKQRIKIASFDEFGLKKKYSAIVNFIGAGDPVRLKKLGGEIFQITNQFDDLAIEYIKNNNDCQYIFLSSGAAYCSDFLAPASHDTKIDLSINKLSPKNWYGLTKLYAESKHRSLSDLGIVDVRVFSYFSHTQKITSGYLMSDIARAISNKTTLYTSSENIIRDYIHPSDFAQLITRILEAPSQNLAVDCYSLNPVEKYQLLDCLGSLYGLQYEFSNNLINSATSGTKPNYFSENKIVASLGYCPALTSIQGIVKEMDLVVKNLNNE